MGAWGVGAFEDDTALDWLGGPFAEDGPAAVEAALSAVIDSPASKELDAPTGIEGRAAAEVVATVFGQPPAGLDEETRGRILTGAGALRTREALPGRALSAAARIWGSNSELDELWTEDEDGTGAEWRAANADLAARLGRVAGG